MSPCIVAIDQGTTGSTVLIVDEYLRVRGKATVEFPQIYPQPGWVEHDPEVLWRSVCEALAKALDRAEIPTRELAAIGITNQRETTVLWERNTMKPIGNAIVWQDRRTHDWCNAFKAHEPHIKKSTGLVLDPYFSATKLRWRFDRDPDLLKQAQAGQAAFGTVDSFLVARLTGGQAHVTDPSNASRTLLFGLHTRTWEEELLQFFGVPRACLPEVHASSEIVGKTSGVPGLPDGIPIAGIAGDQQAALFGQACFTPGDAKCTYGTGAFLLMNTGAQPVASHHGLLTTVGWQLGRGHDAGEFCYALEGSAFIAGAAVQWLRDGLGIIESAHEVEALARSVPDANGVVVVPAFAGLGAPHWRPDARGIITGLTRGSTAAHIARATLEGIALQNYDILHAMQEDSGRTLAALKVDGGAAANDLLMQMQADVLGVVISRPAVLETTALGAAFLAGLGVGLWNSKEELFRVWCEEKRFLPQVSSEERVRLIATWHSAAAKA